MESINVLMLSALFFALTTFTALFFYNNSPKISVLTQVELIPIIIIIGTSNLYTLLSDNYIYLFALFLLSIVQIVLFIYPKKLESSVAIVISILVGCIGIFLNLRHFMVNLTLLKFSLVLFSAALFVLIWLEYQKTNEKSEKDIAEIQLIHLLGVGITAISPSYTIMALGVMVICIHSIAKLSIMTHYYRKKEESIKARLNDLEYKFDRTVEFEAKKRTSHMVEKVEVIRERSQKDPMTKALNRHGLTSEINNFIKDTNIKIFSIAIFDIDHFKGINDTKGHIVGDECLKFLSYSFMINNRKTDVLGRYGGDEFILIMPYVNAPEAIEVCNRMRLEIMQKSNPKFTISMGVSTFPYDGKTFSTLLEVADRGLYVAKENGRNQVAYDGNVFIKK